MTRPINFLDAFTAIEGELRYQDKLWGEGAEGREAYSGGTAFDRSLDEYTLYIHRYCN